MASKRIYGVPDEDTPELTKEMLKRARTLNEILLERGLPPLPGRPKAAVTKTPINLRLDPEIVAHFKAGGEGWQTRINAVLSRHVKAASATAARKKKAS
ncbi:MAG: BrnA antitoxin family protein [Devosia nanyangense]|uniref:BrnA antitoxin family protein n=1 Tax=Devosia nanyangense TaxID=1228055 RepID=A0A933NWR8_9HYPH|nr:BrnA antitoxin family protein [Devosia nanyangense]